MAPPRWFSTARSCGRLDSDRLPHPVLRRSRSSILSTCSERMRPPYCVPTSATQPSQASQRTPTLTGALPPVIVFFGIAGCKADKPYRFACRAMHSTNLPPKVAKAPNGPSHTRPACRSDRMRTSPSTHAISSTGYCTYEHPPDTSTSDFNNTATTSCDNRLLRYGHSILLQRAATTCH